MSSRSLYDVAQIPSSKTTMYIHTYTSQWVGERTYAAATNFFKYAISPMILLQSLLRSAILQRMAIPTNRVLAAAAAAATMILMLSSASGDSAKDKEECTQQLVGLAPCLPYVEGHAKAPTPDCCVGLSGANKKCLCLLIKDRDDPDLGLNINVTLALTLPSRCNSQTSANVSKCPELLGLNPRSPEAQVFYQLGAHSPAQAPAPVAPVLSPGPIAGGNQSSNSCGSAKRLFGWEILAGGALIWCFATSRYNHYMILAGWAI